MHHLLINLTIIVSVNCCETMTCCCGRSEDGLLCQDCVAENQENTLTKNTVCIKVVVTYLSKWAPLYLFWAPLYLSTDLRMLQKLYCCCYYYYIELCNLSTTDQNKHEALERVYGSGKLGTGYSSDNHYSDSLCWIDNICGFYQAVLVQCVLWLCARLSSDNHSSEFVKLAKLIIPRLH